MPTPGSEDAGPEADALLRAFAGEQRSCDSARVNDEPRGADARRWICAQPRSLAVVGVLAMAVAALALWRTRLAAAAGAGDAAHADTEAELGRSGAVKAAMPAYEFVETTRAPGYPKGVFVPCKRGTRCQHVPEWARFAGWVHQDLWEEMWANLTSSADCDSKVLANFRYGKGGERGFGSSMNNFVNEALVSVTAGLPFVLCAPEGVRDVWAESFEDTGLPRCSRCHAEADYSTGTWLAGAGTSCLQAAENPQMLEDMKRFLYRKLFKLKPSVREALRRLKDKLGLEGQRYVGVHLRRGDKAFESGSFRSTRDFAEMARLLCDAVGAKKVFLASDDASELHKLRTHMPEDYEVVEQPRLPPESYAVRTVLGASAARNVVLDVEMLIDADAYVGTASSNLDRFVWFQRDPSRQSVSLDDAGDFLLRNC
mmetsp:Transcript_47083/g.131325  ORF Transcript_47083/g.131325 Transcript_47083/m.131325 type:complete len:427 (-) Transcript_47083:107-1387(-)